MNLRNIYPLELFENRRKLRYSLFLRVGNMKDILQLTPWDFEGVFNIAEEQSKEKKKTIKPLKQSQKDMIKKAKRKL